MASDQILPSKEAALFKSVVSFHEHRQYKKGFKVCEQILKKCPNHAETIAMKGLFLMNLEKKDEAYECVRQAIKLNMKSHVCWHIYGLLRRNDKNYEESIKCYKTALRFDPQNNQILRDLAVLQVQIGAYEGLVETRLAILKAQHQVKSNWTNLTIAYHLAGNLEDAIKTIDQFLDNVCEATGILKTTILDHEMAEMHLYKSMILEESGDFKGCLEHLECLDFRGGDVLAFKIKKAQMLLKNERVEEALPLFTSLFLLLSESIEILTGIEACNLLDLNDESSVAEFRSKMVEIFPSSNLIKSRYLNYLKEDSFKKAFKSYAFPLLRKGAPSLFNSVKSLYVDDSKSEIMFNSVMDFLLTSFSDDDEIKGRFWCHYFLAQHHDFKGELALALRQLDTAYGLDAKTPDLYLLYAKILKHSGQIDRAVKCMEHSRKMDLGDRYINSKTVKYLLRARQFEKAKETISLFLKAGDLEKQMNDLADIQCIWFDLEVGLCLKAQGDLNGALNYFGRVCKLFDDFVDDQLDFHNYAVRKMNLRHYIGMLRYGNVMYREQDFRVAAQGTVEIILIMEMNKTDDLSSLEDVFKTLSISKAEDLIERAEFLVGKLKSFHGLSVRTWELAFDLALLKNNHTEASEALKSIAALGGDVKDRIESLTNHNIVINDLEIKAASHTEKGYKVLLEENIANSPFFSEN